MLVKAQKAFAPEIIRLHACLIIVQNRSKAANRILEQILSDQAKRKVEMAFLEHIENVCALKHCCSLVVTWVYDLVVYRRL
jgi:hypothetical protein